MVLEKPTGLDEAELVRIRDAVREAGVRTIVTRTLMDGAEGRGRVAEAVLEPAAALR